MARHQPDVAIIGAGTAGLAAEKAARQAGATTLLIDPAFEGTTCAAVGCMPSKLLIAAGNAAHGVRHAPSFGIDTAPPDIDGRRVMERLRHERDRFVSAIRDDIAALPDEVRCRSTARFKDQRTLLLDDGSAVEARRIVVATGSSPDIPGSLARVEDGVLTNRSVFEIETLPKSLAVVGAGSLGIELAQAMARLGVAVTVFDAGDRVAGLDDRAASAMLSRILGEELTIHPGVELTAEPAPEGIRLRWFGTSSGDAVFERVLAAAGRPACVDDLDLGNAGIELDRKGVPRFEPATLQCGDSPIFIAGDANGDRPVLHEAAAEGRIAGENAARFPAVRPHRRTVPFTITYTSPAVAVVGRVPDPVDGDIVTGIAEFTDQGRARIEACAAGSCRIYAEAHTGRVTGATVAAPAAEHLGHLLAWSIECGSTVTELLSRPFYHPTFEEGLETALKDIVGKIRA